MKFKVEDKVKFIKEIIHHNVGIGGIFQIISISNDNFAPYLAESQNGNRQWFNEEELEKVEYTYKDLEKSPIGTKITFQNGEVLVKDDKDIFENSGYVRNILELDNFKSRILGKIIKIEEPEYLTVYESKSEILDEAEKRYLRNFIRPFRDEVYYIAKHEYYVDNIKYYRISIVMKNDDDIYLPRYNKKMYKGMETNKKYTIKELGI